MVSLPRVGPQGLGVTSEPVGATGDQPAVTRVQHSGEGIDRGARPRADRGPTPSGPAPAAPGTQPSTATRIGAGILSYSAGQILAVGAMAAIGIGGAPLLLVGVLAGVVAAKATDNYLTTGRTGLFGS